MSVQGTDRSWEEYGRDDPYYGVFPMPRFRRENLSPEVLREFFTYGETQLAALLGRFQKHFGVSTLNGNALDFGCGVGRLLIPMAGSFKVVVGIDVSEGMRAEADRNCAARGLGNVRLYRTLDEVPTDMPFALVHSYIVLQHMDANRAARTVDALLDRLSPGGFAAIHVTVSRRASIAQKLVSHLRHYIPLLNGAINVIRNRPWREPYMEMSIYPVEKLLAQMQRHSQEDLIFLPEWHQDYLGVTVLMRKAAPARP